MNTLDNVAIERQSGNVLIRATMTLSVSKYFFEQLFEMSMLDRSITQWAVVIDREWNSPDPRDGYWANLHIKSEARLERVDSDTIAKGVGRLFELTDDEAAMKFLPESLRTKTMTAFVQNRASLLDSYDATDILQLGMFGKIRWF